MWGRPLRTVVEPAIQHDTRADVRTDVESDEGRGAARGAAQTLAERGKIRIILDHDHAVDATAEHRAERNRAPVVECADSQHHAFVDVGDGWNAYDQRHQLFALHRAGLQQPARLLIDQRANGLGTGLSAGKPDLRSVEFVAAQVGQDEGYEARRDAYAKQAATLGLEANQIRWPTAARFAFAQGLNQTGREQVGDDVGHRGRAHAGGAHQIGT